MTQAPLTSLVYELLDAHWDTVELARGLPGEPWRAHLDYIRALQRKGRELLATADDQSGGPGGSGGPGQPAGEARR